MAFVHGSAFAANTTVVVTPGDPLWVNPASENSGSGSSAITGTMARSGNGSLEMTGDRTRFFGLGSPYAPSSNLGLLDSLRALTFDWAIAVGSVAQLNPDYTPALRVSVWDGAQRSELIWEGAYNGAYGNTTEGVFYTSGINDVFYRFVAGGPGVTMQNGGQVNQTLAAWEAGNWYSDAAYISGISVGVGSSAGNLYRAFADNVTLDLDGNATTYNFEVTAAAAVPEPGTFALLGLGLLGAFGARRSAKKR